LRDGLPAAVGAGPLMICLSDGQARASFRFLDWIGEREIAAALDVKDLCRQLPDSDG